jgi:exodeoxyribonuclease VII large subunit
MIQYSDRLIQIDRQIVRSMSIKRERAEEKLNSTARLLESLSFRRVLKRGYSIVWDEDGKPISSVEGATPGRSVEVEFSDGKAAATISGGSTGAAPERNPKKTRKKSVEPKQGSLL